jgi:hypothetical protein
MFHDKLEKIDLISLKSGFATQIKMKIEKSSVFYPQDLQLLLNEYITRCKLNNIILDQSFFNFTGGSPEYLFGMINFIEHSPTYNSKFRVELKSFITVSKIEQACELTRNKLHSQLEECLISCFLQPLFDVIGVLLPLVGYALFI